MGHSLLFCTTHLGVLIPKNTVAHDSTPLFSLQADLNSTIQDGPGTFYGVSSQYSSAENMTITVSTKVCSFGKQVVEKVEVSAVQCWEYLGMVSMHRILGQCGMDKTLEVNVGHVGTGCSYPTVSPLAATCIPIIVSPSR